MTCQEHQDNYELYAMGLLDDLEALRDLESHLARRCPNCTRGVREANDSFGLMALAAPQIAPPAELRARVIAAAQGVERKAPVAVMPERNRPLWQSLAPWAVAAGLLVGLGYYKQAEQQRTEELVSVRVAMQQLENTRKLEVAELERLRPLADFLRQAETRVVSFGEKAQQPPRGRVLVNPSRGVVLMATNLPTLPEGRTFQMWLIPKSGVPTPAGLFEATGGSAVHIRTGAVTAADATAVAVSVEPSAGSPAPTTTPIVVAAITGL
jgi:anti-sigma-K factor RskA